MSFTEDKRGQIKRYILEKIDREHGIVVKDVAEVYGISMNTVYRYLKELEAAGRIEKQEKGYKLAGIVDVVVLKRTEGDLYEEDEIYEKYIKKYIQGMPDNIVKIWQYSFMEMMNNAIAHSQAEEVSVVLAQDFLNTRILIVDDGIGIFYKIKEFYGYPTLDDAVNELFKGKLTTDVKRHLGEGIFFTSRVLDSFAAISDGKVFTHNKFEEMLCNLEDTALTLEDRQRKRTMIYMELSNFSQKELKEVFDMFSDEDGSFSKTRIPIKNIYDTYPVSRSQAKRLCHRFEKFQEIELDFDGIDEIGQGFAHEIFVVFQNQHADVRLKPVNTSKEVEKMISHVKRTV